MWRRRMAPLAAVALVLLGLGIRCEAGREAPVAALSLGRLGDGSELLATVRGPLWDGGRGVISQPAGRLPLKMSRKLMGNATLDEDLLVAAANGDLHGVNYALIQGADVNAVDLKGNTPLILAAGNGYVDILRTLLRKGADIDAQGYFGATALFNAVDLEELGAVKFLLKQSANTEIRTDDGATPLYVAASNSYHLGVIAMLQHGAKVDARYLRTGHTALLRSSWLGDTDIVKTLIQHNADIEARTTFGRTALHIATLQGHKEVVMVLLASGADIDAVSFGNGEMVVHLAAWQGHLRVLQFLLARGANATAEDSAGRTALHYAAYFPDNVAVLTLLVDEGLDVNKENVYESTPINAAAWAGNGANVAFLLSKGAEPDPDGTIVCGCLNVEEDATYQGCPLGNCENEEDMANILGMLGIPSTPQTLIEAVKANNLEAVKRLIADGKDVDAADIDGDTPLIFASASGFEEITAALLRAGADVALTDRLGFNALHFAAMFGRTEVVGILIGGGAVVDEDGELGFTALHLAAEEGQLKAMKALLDAGAAVNALTNKTSSTPIALAVVGNHLDAVKELVRRGGDATIASAGGVTTLFDAGATVGSELIMDLLVEEGVKVNARSDAGSTAVEFAAYYGNKGGVEFLLSVGADASLAAGDGILDEVCGCLEDVGNADLRQCPLGTCETQSDIDAINDLMAGAEPEASVSGGSPSGPRSAEPGMDVDEEDCSQISDMLARMECVANGVPTT